MLGKKNKIIAGTLLSISLFLSAPCSATFAVVDGFRGTQMFLQSLQRFEQYMAHIEKNDVLKEQSQIWKRMVGLNLPKSETYHYAVNVNIDELDSSKIAPPQKDLLEAVSFVKEKFFLPSDSKKSNEADKARVVNNRKAYVITLAKEVLSFSAGIRSSVSDELESLKKTSSSAGGILQEIELNTQTIKALSLITMANIVLEVRVMELESAKLLLDVSEYLVDLPQGGKK